MNKLKTKEYIENKDNKNKVQTYIPIIDNNTTN